MLLRTDIHRFRNPTYVRSLLRYFFGLDAYTHLTAEQRKLLRNETIDFFEYWRGAHDIAINLLQIGVSATEVCNFYLLVFQCGASPRLSVQILDYTLILTKRGEQGRKFISHISRNATTIGPKLEALEKASLRALVFLVVLQALFNICKGEFAKAIGEIVKAVLCAATAPMALIDLIDNIASFALPEGWQRWPPMRVLRVFNPAALTSLMVENMSRLAYIFTMAKLNKWTLVEEGITKMCDSFEKSPAGIMTQLSRDSVLLMDDLLRGNTIYEVIARSEFQGASLRHLADYARGNPSDY